MSRSIILKLSGNLEKDNLQVSAEIGESGQKAEQKLSGSLPSCPSLLDELEQWRTSYRSIDASFRLKIGAVRHTSPLKHRLEHCQQQARTLTDRLTNWLDVNEFREIEEQLYKELRDHTSVQVLLQARDRRLCQLPWHEWKPLQDDRCVGIAFSTSTGQKALPPKSNKRCRVRVLAILGDSHGINIDVDRRKLCDLPRADVNFLVKPYRYEIEQCLEKQPWDILFFAGHSETQNNQGRIYINSSDSLSIDELKNSLKQTINQGLQIAIFNSCDGLGLAYQLQELNIPRLIVMREPVPDRIAQEFATRFLESYSNGYPFWEAQRDAIKALQRLEREHKNEFPCASWMPITFQNPEAALQNWDTLSGETEILDPVEAKIFKRIEGQEILSNQSNEIYESQVRYFFKLASPEATLEFMTQPYRARILGVYQKRKNGKVKYRVRFAASDWFANLIIKDEELAIKIGEEVIVVARVGLTLLFLPQGYTLIPSDSSRTGQCTATTSFFSSFKQFFRGKN